MTGAQIVCDGLVRIFRSEGVEVVALQGLDLVIQPGELVALVGASGSGKSTLLGILSGLDSPTAGLATVDGQDLAALSGRARLAYRRHTVGFLYQQASHNLLPYLSAVENIEVPMALAGVPRSERSGRAHELLDVLGIEPAAERELGQLSGGEQQRVALATAMANRPAVLLADEPTGSSTARAETKSSPRSVPSTPPTAPRSSSSPTMPGSARRCGAPSRSATDAPRLKSTAGTMQSPAPTPRNMPCSTRPAGCSCPSTSCPRSR